MESLTLLFGRLHPVLVHLPIGILLVAFLFELLSLKKQFKKLRAAVSPALGLGSFFGILTGISGYLLSREGGYDPDLTEQHQLVGIITVGFSVVLYFFTKNSSLLRKSYRKSVRFIAFLPLVGLITYTGHLGGSITHGENFLFEPVTVKKEEVVAAKLISNIDEAAIYADIIKPLLDKNCNACHSAKKQKGNLRLDEVEFIQKGGKHGTVFLAGNPEQSELYERILLPIEEEHHMPPRGRKQLSSSEMELLREWIVQGAEFNKMVNELQDAKKMKVTYLAARVEVAPDSVVPAEKVEQIDDELILSLKSKGIIVVPVAVNSNYVKITFLEPGKVTDETIKSLAQLSSQALELKLSRTSITDEGLKELSGFTNLRRLFIDNTSISDQGIESISGNNDLTYLNLVGTGLTDQGIQYLNQLKQLEEVFLFRTKVSDKGILQLQQSNPSLRIDRGGYTLPALISDTVIYSGKVY